MKIYLDGSPLGEIFMATITECSTLDFVMLATTEILLFDFFRIFSITFEDKLKRLEFSALVRSITEWLILRFSASAIIISLALLEIDLKGLLLSNNGFSTVSRELAAISNKTRLSSIFFCSFLFRHFDSFFDSSNLFLFLSWNFYLSSYLLCSRSD